MAEKLFHIVFNAGAGSAAGLTCKSLRERFEQEGHVVSVDPNDDAPFADRIARALESEANIIVAAGGDGTATALASAMLDTDKTLAVLPLGTANLLARDLKLPLDLEAAITAIGALEPKRIDVGEVNGHFFLHKVVIGFVPGIAAGREQIRGRTDLGAKIGFLRYFFRRLARARRIAVEITPKNGEPRVERVQAIAVANNDYDEGLGRFFSRGRLDQGTLSLYVLKHLTLSDLIRLTTEMFLGTWREDEALEIENVTGVSIRLSRKLLKVMIDGEVMTLTTPLKFRIRPAALSVLAPVPAADPAPAPAEAELAQPG